MIDLRSDVVAPPTEEMWEAMRRATLGWALVGEDPSVNTLQALGAAILGKEAALFVPTCGAANLLALLSLTRPGEQVALESTMHLAWSEGQSLAFPAGLFPLLVDGARGAPDPSAVEAAIATPRIGHLGRTTLVCLENTHTNAGGTVLDSRQIGAVTEVAHRHGARVHVDGARLFNAAVTLGQSAEELVRAVDTVAVSLNKGLCAPEGALLAGSRETIDLAQSHAKCLGLASWHKAGIAAAAGLVALTTMIDRLADDHRRAMDLARGLGDVPGLRVDLAQVQTNIALAEVKSGATASELVARLAECGVLTLARSERQVRFVTHRLIGDAEVEQAVAAVVQSTRDALRDERDISG
jgi:threonine aldolase